MWTAGCGGGGGQGDPINGREVWAVVPWDAFTNRRGPVPTRSAEACCFVSVCVASA